MLRVKDWQSFQSYKDRTPPWIRLHKGLLDNFEFQQMSANARAILPMLWLLASEDKDPVSGLLRIRNEEVAFRLRRPLEEINSVIKECIMSGFLVDENESNQEVTKSYESVTPESRVQRQSTETDTTLRAREPDAVPVVTGGADPYRAIRDYGSSVFPVLETKASQIIDEWLKAGAVPQDAIGEIDRAKANGKEIKSWSYFTGGVMDAAATRKHGLPEGKPRHAAGGGSPEKKSYGRKMQEAAVKGLMDAREEGECPY